MASLQDIGISAAINLLSACAFLIAFAILRLQPVNDRVYFPKWYLKGIRGSPRRSRGVVTRFVNLDWRTYIRFLNWMPAALKMPEPELIEHAGLDSAVYIRIYLLGLKMFVPISILAFGVLVPVNWTGGTLENIKDLTFSNVDKLSISNVPPGSPRFWAHLIMTYVFSIWTCYTLYMEYKTVATMRLRYLAAEKRRPDQFTVLVRNVPPDPDESVNEHVEHFFCVNHPDHYLSHQIVYNANELAKLVSQRKTLQNWWTYYQNKYDRNPSKRPTTKTGYGGFWGTTVDAIDYYDAKIQDLAEKEAAERQRVLNDTKAIVPAAFVSFKSRWGAAVCAQTQLCHNPTIWLTEWAPEPRDIFWDNLSIPYVELTIRRLLMAIALFLLVFFFMIPIAFVQSLANIEGIQKVFPFLKPLIDMKTVKSVIQGFLPGIALKIFLILLPTILMTMSQIEGYTSLSYLDRRSAEKYFWFIIVNVFLGSIITGTAFQQLKSFLEQPPTEIPKTVGVSIPMKATFFITYVMVDGWAGVAAEILRLVPLIIFHLKNTFLVKTEQDRQQAMDPGHLDFSISEPRIQFYFLLGLVYAAVTPILLPFIIVFFTFSYIVFRHQVINVYDQKYESGAKYWPSVHRRLIICLLISQLLMMGLLSTKKLAMATAMLLPLPILTIWFNRYCAGRFESAFSKFPLQEAMVKDTLEKATEPNLNLKEYLRGAYVHPMFKGQEMDRPQVVDEEESNPLVPTKRTSQSTSRYASEANSAAATPTDKHHTSSSAIMEITKSLIRRRFRVFSVLFQSESKKAQTWAVR
ncbi:PREDICTED: CSC1-like protein At4g02900 isoform X2 [Tarenaya hassleriana]|uniref:CSC1-like protein At4g02900 isoform X2 n=1 Tax=Tarenaya hassleriana TaxID=28532 RepID=UPI00053C9B3A|nr:PREDICTED: CSC1-like protein At4g02900 isoform X2 [Tarenaya hassleriana]